jgi:histidinol dehydrogenase
MAKTEQGKSEKFFREFGKKVDQFVVEVKEAGDRAHTEMEARLEELRIAGEKIRKEATDKDRWNEVEKSLKKAGKEMEKAFSAAFGKKEPKKSR